jgi:hypothetical protein
VGDLLVIMAQFVLKINLGNDAMQTGQDISDAIHQLKFERYYSVDGLMGCVRDINGNTIGSWRVK